MAGRAFHGKQQTAQVKKSEHQVDAKSLGKNGASAESRIPPTKAPVTTQGRKAKPGSSKADKRPVSGRGEAMKTPNLIGSWSAR